MLKTCIGVLSFCTLAECLAIAQSGYTIIDLGVTHASGINNRGDVVGCSGGPFPYLYSQGELLMLPNAHLTCAVAINNGGRIVGYTNLSGPNPPRNIVAHAAEYYKGQITDLVDCPSHSVTICRWRRPRRCATLSAGV